MALLIKADGSEMEVHPANGKCFTLEELQGFVGGYIQEIDVGDREMYLNEEGKYLNLPLNARATRLAVMAGIADTDFVVGSVVIGNSKEFVNDEE